MLHDVTTDGTYAVIAYVTYDVTVDGTYAVTPDVT